jgi:hypothetical protein
MFPTCRVVSQQAEQEQLSKKNILGAIRFHLEGMKEEKIKFPLNRTDAETFVFAV